MSTIKQVEVRMRLSVQCTLPYYILGKAQIQRAVYDDLMQQAEDFRRRKEEAKRQREEEDLLRRQEEERLQQECGCSRKFFEAKSRFFFVLGFSTSAKIL